MDITGRFSSKNDPQRFDFQLPTTLGAGVNVELKVFVHDFWPKNDLHKKCDLRIYEKMETTHFGGAMIFWTSLADSPRKITPKGSDFQVSTNLGAGVNVALKGFVMTFGRKTTCTNPENVVSSGGTTIIATLIRHSSPYV